MIAMQRIALLLAVCGTFAVSVQAQAKGVKTAAAIPSMAEYDTADFTHVCLRANSIHNCDLVAVVSGLYIEQGLQCCHGDKPYHNSMSESLMMGEDSIGKCSWTFNPFLLQLFRLFKCLKASLENNDKRRIFNVNWSCETFKLGTYTVECAFNKGSEDCGDGVCDDMILQSTGNMYWTPDAYLKSLPHLSGDPTIASAELLMALNATLEEGDAAGKSGPEGWNSMMQTAVSAYQMMLSQSPPTNKRKAKVESSYKHGEPEFTLGAALVTSGPVSIFSKHTNLKYKEGFLHATPLFWPTGDPYEAGAPKTHSIVVDPYRYDLKLKRGGGY
jgi:hypothetical protein